MAAGSNEKIIKCQQPLAILKLNLCQSDVVNFRPRLHHLGYRGTRLIRKEGQQNAVKSLWLRIDCHDWLAADVFSRVRHKPILS